MTTTRFEPTGLAAPSAVRLLRDIADRLEATPHSAEQQILAATEAWDTLQTVGMPAVAAMRRAAARDLRAEGWTLMDIANLLGVTESRASRIVSGNQ